MAVPKRKQSRANTHARRSQWKATPVQLVKTIENGKTVYSLPHRAKVVEDSAGTPLYMEYKGGRAADVGVAGSSWGRRGRAGGLRRPIRARPLERADGRRH